MISTRSSPNCNLSTAQVTMLMHPVKWTTFIIQKTRLNPKVIRKNPNSASRFRPGHSDLDFFLNQPVKNVPLPASLNLISLLEFKLLLLKSTDYDKGVPHWSTQGPWLLLSTVTPILILQDAWQQNKVQCDKRVQIRNAQQQKRSILNSSEFVQWE